MMNQEFQEQNHKWRCLYQASYQFQESQMILGPHMPLPNWQEFIPDTLLVIF